MPSKMFKKVEFSWLIEFVIWITIALVSFFIGDYIAGKLEIVDRFAKILISAVIISIIAQIVRSHTDKDSMDFRWVLFYFLTYLTVTWIMQDFVLSNFDIGSKIVYFALIGLAIAIMILAVDKIGLRSRTVPWVSFMIIVILAVSYYSYFTGTSYFSQDSLSSKGLACPTVKGDLTQHESDFSASNVNSKLNALLDTSVWRVENNFRYCYQGKYQGQRPDWFYCDDLIVSRWEVGNEGTIDYRWYTAVSAEFKPVNSAGLDPFYNLESFSCDNGQRVTVKKGVVQYYAYDSRDGTPIRIKY